MAALERIARFESFGTNPFDPYRSRAICERIEGTTPELKRQLRRLCPRVPGVYGMIGETERLVYVGKSRNLRARLRSYFHPHNAEEKAGRIVREARALVWETAPNEFSALLRELQLIRAYRPRWNVHGQPKRTRPTWLCLGRPPVRCAYLSPEPAARATSRFGPIMPGRRARLAVLALNTLFKLRDCPERQVLAFADQLELFAESRRPGCLRYEMKTCLGPCVAACSKAEYDEQIAAARRFLRGQDDSVLERLQEQMAAAAAALQFERAARIRNDLDALTWIRDRIERLDTARRRFTFVYRNEENPRRPVWYCVARGQVVGAVQPVQDRETAERALVLVEEHLSAPPLPNVDTPKQPVDSLMLTAAWFRQRPEELRRTLSPAAALELCQGYCRPAVPR